MKSEKQHLENYPKEVHWEKNCNWNEWTLVHHYFELGGFGARKNKVSDGYEHHIYGWVHEISHAPNIGKWQAGCPKPWDEETESDADDLGVFDTREQAQAAVFAANPPLYSYHI